MIKQPTEWENIFTGDMSNKELISNIYNELLHLNTRKKQPDWKIGRGHE